MQLSSRKYFSVLFSIFIHGLIAFGQNDIYDQMAFDFEKLSEENGVTQSITYSIQQDSIGNIWIASEEGLIKYYSNNAKIYNKYNGFPVSVGNKVLTVFIDHKNDIWISTDEGLCKYDPKMDRFDLIRTTTNSNPALIKEIIEDKKGTIWIAAFNGLWKLAPESQDHVFDHYATKLNIQCLFYENDTIYIGSSTGLFLFNIKTETLTPKNLNKSNYSITSLYKKGNNLFIGTKSDGLFIVDEDTNLVTQKYITENNKEQHRINDIVIDNDQNIYIATDGGGFFYFDTNFELISSFQHNENIVNSLSSNGVYDILIDNENILWVATYGGGVNYLDKNKAVFKKIRHDLNNKNSLANNFTRAIEKDNNGNIWFGTKGGVSIWNRSTETWIHLDQIRDIVMALEADSNYMWVGTYNNGALKVNIDNFSISHYSTNTPKKIAVKKVYTIFKDTENDIWFGGVEGELTQLKSNGLTQIYPLRDVKSITQTKEKNILVAGRFGVTKIDSNNGVLEQLSQIAPTNNRFNYVTVNAVIETDDQQIILSTNGAGIIIYNPKNESVKSINVSSGMPSDIVQAVIPYSKNDLWASTTKGLVNIKIIDKDTIINVFDNNDGLASTEYNYGSYASLSKNEYIFGGVNGLTLFNPTKVKSKNSIPKVIFEDFSLFNKTLQPGEGPLKAHLNTLDHIDLKYSENSLALSFLGILQSSSSKIKYSWKLDGLDENWSTPSTNNQVNFTNLSPGDYSFKVKAANRNGEWSSIRSLQINVNPPWWATKLAFFIYFILALAILFFTIYFTRLMITKKHAEEQISFFNNLTHEIRTPLTILLSSLDSASKQQNQESNKQVKKTIKRLNSLFEQMLNFQKVTSNKDFFDSISKINTTEFVQKAINNFKPMIDEKKLNVSIADKWKKQIFYYDKEALNKIFYNLITNAIKYTPENGNIDIVLKESNKGELLLKITDTGIGIPKDQQKYILNRYYRARNVINSQLPGTGLGLIMIKKLIEKYGGSISFISNESKGTTFNIILKNQESVYNAEQIDGRTQSDNPVSLDHSLQAQEFSDSKILVVEDNDELRRLLLSTLGVYFQVFEASNGLQGLKSASEIFPDIILTDLIMPEMDGMEMATKIHNDISLNHIPIFMMSVLNSSKQKLESIEHGIAEYIEKPINFDLLIAKMVSMLGFQKRMRQKYIHKADVDEATEYRTTKDKDFITKLEDFIIEKLMDDSFSVNDLCLYSGMSRTSLYMKLKSLVDLSPQDFLINTKLRYARQQLIKGDASIKEVAYQSGFSNPKYFSTSFKKFYGISPSKFIDSLDNSI